MLTLNHKVGIHIPKSSNDGIPFGDSLIESVHTTFAKKYGGATSIDGLGSWIDDNTGKLYLEPITILYSNIGEYDFENGAKDFVAGIAKDLKAELNQYAIAYFVDDTLIID